jgi:hypothetical protein
MTDEAPEQEFHAWATERKLNPNSPTTRQLYENRHLTVQDYVGRFRRGIINAILPDVAKSMSVEDAIKVGRVENVNIRKLLTDNRDKFQRR